MFKNKFLKSSIIAEYVKAAAGLLGGILIFTAIVSELNYMYVDNIGGGDGAWERILWHNFYNDRGKIDNICLGSSHVYSDINPMVLDEINGQYNFDLSSSAQRLNGSYYLLKEAARHNDISHVYVDLFYKCNVQAYDDPDSDPINTAYHWNWSNTDNMKFSLNKIEYMLSIAGPEKYADILLPFIRYRADLDKWDVINERMNQKNTEAYINYKRRRESSNGYSECREQGYFYSNIAMSEFQTLFKQGTVLKKDPMGKVSEKYLRNMIKYCLKNNISITLFVAPIDKLQLISTRNYDNFITQIRKIAQEYGVPYYDFNLTKEEYMDIYRAEYWRDYSHLNYRGADIFTRFFGEVMSRSEEENSAYFYETYAEKLSNEKPKIYGLYYRDIKVINEDNSLEEQSETLRQFYIASNRDSGIEYKVVLTNSEGIKQVIQDYSENKELTLGQNEQGILQITARSKDDAIELEPMEIKLD